jgi:dihydrofolate reductase
MRRMIAAMKVSLDGRMEGPDGVADWVEAWSEDYDLTGRIDACVLGGGMYPGYETYWSGVREAPEAPTPVTGRPPTAGERDWARVIAGIPHFVLSRSMDTARWPSTRFLRGIADVAALKRQAGRDIYLLGGGATVVACLDAGLVDELRLIVYPLVAGDGRSLFEAARRRHHLRLQHAQALPGGRVSLAYAAG